MEDIVQVMEYLKIINTDKFCSKHFFVPVHKVDSNEINLGKFFLQKIIYISNIIHYIMYDEFLVQNTEWKRWANGPVDMTLHHNINYYDVKKETDIKLSDKTKTFLKNINNYFDEFTWQDLYEITHYDKAFKKTEENKDINIIKYINNYKKNYKKITKQFKEQYDASL